MYSNHINSIILLKTDSLSAKIDIIKGFIHIISHIYLYKSIQ